VEFASLIARRAGDATLRYFGDRVPSEAKADGTPVTLADRAAETVLRKAIGEQFPDDGILGEEFGESESRSGYRWILDPIDGTRSFMRGVPLYAVLVGLEVRGIAAVGVIHLPALDETVAAANGVGCYRDGVRSRVSDTAELGNAVGLTTDEVFTARSSVGSGWQRLAGECKYVRGWGDAYGHALVATGRADVMVDPVLETWDAAPLLPILTEAGGSFTSITGEATIHGRSGVSTNGRLHNAVMRHLTIPAGP
ncbi:MAG: inositol monophosphatase family protein, partial [Gemmatimonadota bacterium]